jgi:glycosyltransferase involved in cell wall biosynthesis
LCVHHRLDPDQGAPGATLALGAALEGRGCTVEYLGYDQVFGELEHEGVGHQLRFPWSVARVLRRRAGAFDVVDASTGDAWVWATLGRPGGRRTGLVTRAHGLEHVGAQRVRQAARESGERPSWKYPIYHGGGRLWEVRRSLRVSEQCIMLNSEDADYARDRLGLPAEGLNVIPNGVADHFHGLEAPEPVDGPLRLAFVGHWTIRKGKDLLVAIASALAHRAVDFRLVLLGTLVQESDVLAAFPPELRDRVSVTPRFANEQLPGLLAGQEVFVFPSRFEGSSVALIEAMACGLAPVATPVGSASAVVVDGSGVVVEQEQFVDALARLGADRDGLLDMRRRAQGEARRYTWDDVAERTLRVYERAVAARSTASRKRAPTEGQL